jgi:WD40 repeat protein
MRPRIRGFVHFITLILLASNAVESQDHPSILSPTQVLKIPGLRASDLAPDETYLAALVVQEVKAGQSIVTVQTWDIRTATLVHSKEVTGESPAKGRRSYAGRSYVRYSGDGALLAVYPGGRLVHVFEANDLQEAKQIALDPLAGITGFEVSPVAHILAVRVAKGEGTSSGIFKCCHSLGGEVRLYDLDSGEELRSWQLEKGALDRGSGVAWRSDGKLVAAAAPDSVPCQRFGGTIYLFDPASENAVSTFHVPYLPGSLAFGTDDKLYVVSNTCGGYFANWAPPLPIFDASSGRQIGEIRPAKVGFRHEINISRNKQLLVAYMDREKTTLEGLEDTLKTSDEQWGVWDLSTESQIARLPGMAYLSASARLAIAASRNEVQIFSIPAVKQ